MAQFNKLLRKLRNNPFGASVFFWRYPFDDRCYLCNFHIALYYRLTMKERSELGKKRVSYTYVTISIGWYDNLNY